MKRTRNFVGELLSSQRTKKGLTLEELAVKLHTDRHYIWKLENGKINMSLDYLDKILEALKCTHKDFFKL